MEARERNVKGAVRGIRDIWRAINTDFSGKYRVMSSQVIAIDDIVPNDIDIAC